jgi:hypothetical protein
VARTKHTLTLLANLLQMTPFFIIIFYFISVLVVSWLLCFFSACVFMLLFALYFLWTGSLQSLPSTRSISFKQVLWYNFFFGLVHWSRCDQFEDLKLFATLFIKLMMLWILLLTLLKFICLSWILVENVNVDVIDNYC